MARQLTPEQQRQAIAMAMHRRQQLAHATRMTIAHNPGLSAAKALQVVRGQAASKGVHFTEDDVRAVLVAVLRQPGLPAVVRTPAPAPSPSPAAVSAGAGSEKREENEPPPPPPPPPSPECDAVEVASVFALAATGVTEVHLRAVVNHAPPQRVAALVLRRKMVASQNQKQQHGGNRSQRNDKRQSAQPAVGSGEEVARLQLVSNTGDEQGDGDGTGSQHADSTTTPPVAASDGAVASGDAGGAGAGDGDAGAGAGAGVEAEASGGDCDAHVQVIECDACQCVSGKNYQFWVECA